MAVGLLLAGRYQLIEKLGSGGMGSVWRARDRTLNAEVAVKLIDPDFVSSTEAVARFRREAQSAAAIRSTHVVQILDHGVDDGTPFIAMELLKGESLAERLERVGKLSPEQTAHIMGHVARALALAHGNGIVHRDMKPDNVFLVSEEDEDVGKVLDFGIARQLGGLGNSSGVKTKTGAVLGTPYYMSPEQATGQAVDHLTDIWSFGVIASECITGKRAFDSDSLGGLFHAICMAPPPVPSQLGPVPVGFDGWFARAVARDKSARFQTVREAAAELRAICGHTSNRPSAVSIPAERGDTALSPQVESHIASAPSARPALVKGLQTTAAPSSQSIPGLPKVRRRTSVFIASSIAALIIVGLYAGWRWMSQPGTAGVAFSNAGSATTLLGSSSQIEPLVSSALPALSVAPVASVADDTRPIEVGKGDVGRVAKTAEHPVSMPRRAPASTGRAPAAAETVAPPAPVSSSHATTSASAKPATTNPFATRK